MNSEKVKEIKELLLRKAKEYESQTLLDILALINELESENERLMKLQAKGGYRVAELGIENQQLKDRIAELEKENALIKNSVAMRDYKTLEEISNNKVKQFAEKLKNKLFEFFQDNEELDGKISVGPLYVDVIGVEAKDGTIISLGLIDELLKEYEK